MISSSSSSMRGKISTLSTSRIFATTSSCLPAKRTYNYQPVINNGSEWHGTTIIAVRKKDKVVIMGDGQVTLGDHVIKGNAKKVRRIGKDVIAGFAGTTADAMTLFELLEAKLDEHRGQLLRSCVELAKAWRTDKFLRKLEAVMIVAVEDNMPLPLLRPCLLFPI
eukprot:TRINITY_DN2558_c1_g1_i4.p1 TRINITY_DN2558_c1_g1~~TRINITY_DN2558_c1_g1_i4.p1  ORF type:complete len:165 (-),score=46.16 TRINITY_DN2558_c1_g1_i4:161-655(-)